MNILAVDDDPIILDLLRQVLNSFGLTDLKTVGSAAEALSEINKSAAPFDCLLLDIEMPEIDGIELCEKIREISGYHDTPIVMLTAMSEKKYIDAAFRAGATDYVTKPFETIELRARLHSAKLLRDEQKKLSSAIYYVRKTKALRASGHKTPLQKAFPVKDVDRVIPIQSMRNYLAQLDRSALLACSVVAFKINNIEHLFQSMTEFDYVSMVTDAAEAIVDGVPFDQFLCTYAGNGVFVCVASGVHAAEPQEVLASIHSELEAMELYLGDGRPLIFDVSMGKAVRLPLSGGRNTERTLVDAITSVALSPVQASQHQDSELKADFPTIRVGT